MVGEIQTIAIIQRNFVTAIALPVIPTDKINRILKVVASRPVIAGGIPVLTPNIIFSLGITISIAQARPRNNSEDFPARWTYIMPVLGFLIHDRHHNGNGRSPAFFRVAGMLVPGGLLIKDRTQVFRVGWRNCSTSPH